ncbi:CDP-diacylglycerol--glycerol-3-phosphate 3-phosphatidyltransferase [Endomicrobiia bacterium]|nr:CDP-diacylglycerol--glycerol-3-phosphate 3-phosphatidyltransferase [Endomicrobiia bacterium]
MNSANKLTVTRIFLVPFYILFMELGGFYNSILALIVFCIASITDFFDGQIARKNRVITPLGVFLDPLADKLLMTAAFICFVDIHILGINAWMVIVIIARDFLINGLRSILACRNVIVPSDKFAKFKTTSQIIAIIIVMIILISNEGLFKFTGMTAESLKLYDHGHYAVLAVIMKKTPLWAILVTVILTVSSGLNYVWKYRRLLDENN